MRPHFAIPCIAVIIVLSQMCMQADASNVPPHKTTISLVSATSSADHIVEPGGGQLFTVVGINPITYSQPYITNTTTTIASQFSLSLPPGLPLGHVGGFFEAHRCGAMLDICKKAIQEMRLDHDDLIGAYAARLVNAFIAWNYLNNQSTAYDVSAKLAAANGTTPPPISGPSSDCLNDIARYATWLASGQSQEADKNPLAALKCKEHPWLSDTRALGPDQDTTATFFYGLAAYQKALIALQNDLKQSTIANASKISFQSQLSALDLTSYSPTGPSGQILVQKEQPLLPFANLDPNTTEATYPVWCHPHNLDTISNALTVVATNRFDSTKNLAQAVGVVDCPGALALSAGSGYSRIPLVAFQVVPTVVNGVVTKNRIGYSQNAKAQTTAAAFAHYYLFGLGGQTALFGTAGVGSSSTNLGVFYGVSIGVNRRIFLNFAENVAGMNALAPGFSVNEVVPGGFSIPTMVHSTTRFSITLSVGGGVATSSAAPAATTSKH